MYMGHDFFCLRIHSGRVMSHIHVGVVFRRRTLCMRKQKKCLLMYMSLCLSASLLLCFSVSLSLCVQAETAVYANEKKVVTQSKDGYSIATFG
jgi:hypothetical protein